MERQREYSKASNIYSFENHLSLSLSLALSLSLSLPSLSLSEVNQARTD